MTWLAPPPIGATVAIDLPAGPGMARTVQRRIGTMRDHGDGRYTCIVLDQCGAAETVTIAPAVAGGWVCVEPPADIQAAIHLSARVLRGEVLHGSASEPLHLLARAVQQLTGVARPAGPPCAAQIATRINGGTP
ncbi:hypothetical protein [Azospirillum sp. A39]|uniref:hypothetical protein n=1 Tax=Azospirillum sp. A39 TaxID=3462279 RepID=UPI004045E4AA